MMIPFLLLYIVGFGLLSRRDIYQDFLEGASEGLKTVAGLIPTLIGLLTGVGILRVSGRTSWNCDRICGACAAAGASGVGAYVFFQWGHWAPSGSF